MTAYVSADAHYSFEKAAKSDRFKEFGNKFGFAPVWVPGPEFEKQIRSELDLFKDIKAKYID